ncbi:ABC transporter substrate-binding protein [Anaerocolumna cellulosilytica]|uniref:ABC transporter substrate-binding protein n=1 Tax=Anaerocolumna cellulosilytica TaxID=433286 RepID=A0A6S6QY82_9FIRM|nr:extracellular solute-binding protein [Anaerocolumna cellulosilytica]MBB5196215.1 arabinogalactan oligomer/maltooligosaccharide transport system substrate-binding protein [Anaerocolumna cellulosilytica]BCJ92465.1 ABC transporter substrate-binding protein [Anaerocolumna cellulosilytica]
MKKMLMLLMVFLVVLGSFAACGNKNEPTGSNSGGDDLNGGTNSDEATPTQAGSTEVTDVTLKVWAPQEEQEILKQMCETFKAAHPQYNITFDYGVVSEADAANELQKDPAAGADVFAFASDQTATLANAGILYPITLNAEAVKDGNSNASVQAATVNGQLYGYPFTPNSWFMYYDKSKYSEEEVLSLDAMMAKDLGAGVKNFSVDINNSWYISAFFFAGGSTLFGPDGTDPTNCTFNDANGLAVGNYLIDLAANPKFLDDQDGNILTAFVNGSLAAACSGTWNAEAIKEALGDNYAATKLPSIKLNGEDKQLSNFADFKLIGVNSQTINPIPAMELAEYLAGEECQKIRYEARSIAPTNLKLAGNPVVLANPAVAALSLQSSYSTLQSSIPQMGNYWTPAEAFGTEILNGTVTKDNIQQKLDDMVSSILSTIG